MNFAWVTVLSLIACVGGIGTLLWQTLPSAWRSYLESGDGALPLLILFLAVPAVLGLLGFLGLIIAFRIMTRFATREEARSFLLAGPLGGHIGSLERWILSWFKPASSSDI
jgi:hypothetical protein